MTRPAQLRYYHISFDKPLYQNEKGYFIRLWDKHISSAIQNKKKLFIKLEGVGKAIYTTGEWLEKAEYTEQVFKRPDEPMKLVGNYFKPGHGLDTKVSSSGLGELTDVSMPVSVYAELKRRFPEAIANLKN